MAVKQTAGREALGQFAPKFAQLNDDVLFGEVWSREGQLPLKLRSLVTVTALISKGIVDSSLKYHLESARKNGVTAQEMVSGGGQARPGPAPRRCRHHPGGGEALARRPGRLLVQPPGGGGPRRGLLQRVVRGRGPGGLRRPPGGLTTPAFPPEDAENGKFSCIVPENGL